jgi:hypothetical protein
MPELKLHLAKRIVTGCIDRLCFDLPGQTVPDARRLIKAGVERFDDRYNVTISTPSRKRTTGDLSQSHHLNGHIQQIAVATGNDFDDVKLYVKRRAMSMGLPYLTNENGDVVYSLIDGEPLPMSERDMTTIQCGWCIDCAHIVAADFGVTLVEN